MTPARPDPTRGAGRVTLERCLKKAHRHRVVPATLPTIHGRVVLRREGNIQDVLTGIMALHKRIFELEKSLVASGVSHAPDLRMLGPELRKTFVPAWRRKTQGEPRWHIVLAVTAAMFLQWPLPGRLVLFQPSWILPALEGALLVVLVSLDRQMRIDRESKLLRRGEHGRDRAAQRGQRVLGRAPGDGVDQRDRGQLGRAAARLRRGPSGSPT